MDPTPITLKQFVAYLSVLVREATWIVPNVAREVRRWREAALTIPNDVLRCDAVTTLERERLNVEGAALFAVLSRKRSRPLVELLVAYQVALDYLDTVTERPSPDSLEHGAQLHLALWEALDPAKPMSEYFLHRPGEDDGGYLRQLVECCRSACDRLPSYHAVRAPAVCAGRRLAVQVLNHEPAGQQRDRLLGAWAAQEFPSETESTWFELTAAASSTLGLYALLGIAADATVKDAVVCAIDSAYHPWICMACTLLDCFVDQLDDEVTGDHNYLDHYADHKISRDRLLEVVNRAAGEARALPRGMRHATITTAMIAMYLSHTNARTTRLRKEAEDLLSASGSLTRMSLPMLRGMRSAHARL
jgi:tetraprenyl-beta-curcumene synthase